MLYGVSHCIFLIVSGREYWGVKLQSSPLIIISSFEDFKKQGEFIFLICNSCRFCGNFKFMR